MKPGPSFWMVKHSLVFGLRPSEANSRAGVLFIMKERARADIHKEPPSYT